MQQPGGGGGGGEYVCNCSRRRAAAGTTEGTRGAATSLTRACEMRTHGKRDGRAVRIGYLMHAPSLWQRGLSSEKQQLRLTTRVT